jgi:hypothetical protein
MCGVYRWLRDNGLPEGFQIWRLSLDTDQTARDWARSRCKLRDAAARELK